jgi:hypothetical protein
MFLEQKLPDAMRSVQAHEIHFRRLWRLLLLLLHRQLTLLLALAVCRMKLLNAGSSASGTGLLAM